MCLNRRCLLGHSSLFHICHSLLKLPRRLPTPLPSVLVSLGHTFNSQDVWSWFAWEWQQSPRPMKCSKVLPRAMQYKYNQYIIQFSKFQISLRKLVLRSLLQSGKRRWQFLLRWYVISLATLIMEFKWEVCYLAFSKSMVVHVPWRCWKTFGKGFLAGRVEPSTVIKRIYAIQLSYGVWKAWCTATKSLLQLQEF